MNLLLITNTFPFIKKGNAEASFLRVLIPFFYKRFNRIYLIPTVNNNYKFNIYRSKFFLIGGNNLLNFNVLSLVILYFRHFKILKFDILKIKFDRNYLYNIFRSNIVFFKSLVIFGHIEKKIKEKIILQEDLVIYSFWFDDFVLGLILLKFKYGLKLMVSAHGYDLYHFRNKGSRIPFREYSLSIVDTVFPDSNVGVEYLKLKYPEICNPLKVKVFFPSIVQKSFQAHYSTDGIVRILSVSRTHPVKRLFYLLDTLKKLESEYCDIVIEWTHIGTGSEYASLCNLISNLKFTRFKIQFVGNLSDLRINRMYREKSIDYYLNVSSSEGTSLALIDAISFGVPVICTNVGGNIFVGERCGFLVDVDFTHHELFKILNIVKYDKSYYNQLKENCISTYRDYFNPQINVNNFVSEIIK